MSGAGPFTFEGEYLHLQDGSTASVIPVTEDFWPRVMSGQMPQLDQGRLMTCFSFDADWPSWERHPAGEEAVILLSGAVELLLETPGGIQSVTLSEPGSYVLVPRDTWHTAKTRVPTKMLFITPGAGTENRPT